MRCRRSLVLAGSIAVVLAFATRVQEAPAKEPLAVSPEVMAAFAEYKARRTPMYFPTKARPCAIETFAAGSAAGATVALFRPGACSDLRRFGHLADFKAFATTDPLKLRIARGWSFRGKEPDDAVEYALERCGKSRTALSVSAPCRVFAIGDIVVHGMTEAEQRAAMEVYGTNRDATSADLPPGN